MIVGGYELHLYCDAPGHVDTRKDGKTDMGLFHADSGEAARKKARKAGWSVNLVMQTALCPVCKKKKTQHA